MFIYTFNSSRQKTWSELIPVDLKKYVDTSRRLNRPPNRPDSTGTTPESRGETTEGRRSSDRTRTRVRHFPETPSRLRVFLENSEPEPCPRGSRDDYKDKFRSVFRSGLSSPHSLTDGTLTSSVFQCNTLLSFLTPLKTFILRSQKNGRLCTSLLHIYFSFLPFIPVLYQN